MTIVRYSTSTQNGSQDERFGDPDDTIQNRVQLCGKLGIDISRLVFCNQKHSTNIAIVENQHLANNYLGSSKLYQDDGIDALITNQKDMFLCILTADCLPVFFYDMKKEVIGIAHCGWKGLLNKLPVKMLEAMQNRLGCDLNNIHVETGPGINDCCYRVDQAPDQRIKKFQETFGPEVEQNGYLDLRYALKTQLLAFNIPAGNIDTASSCTCCNPDYFSYYREKPHLSGEQISIIGIQ